MLARAGVRGRAAGGFRATTRRLHLRALESSQLQAQGGCRFTLAPSFRSWRAGQRSALRFTRPASGRLLTIHIVRGFVPHKTLYY